MKKFSHNDIYFVWENNRLEVGNRQLCRQIDFSQGMPQTLSLQINQQSVALANQGFDFHLAGFPYPGSKHQCNYQVQDVAFELLQAPDGDGAKVAVKVFEPVRELTLVFNYILYSDLPVMAVETEICSQVIPYLYWHLRQQKADFQSGDAEHGRYTIADSLLLNNFTPECTIELQMRTDLYDEPILRHDIETGKTPFGNILLANNAEGMRFFFLQEAPPSSERRGDEPGDFAIQDSLVASFGSGITPADVTPGKLLKTNRIVCGMASDGNAAKLIKQYLLCRQQASKTVAGIVTVNPWGCGRFPKLLNAEFLQKEILSASKLNADVYQIDDGYEHGLLQDLAVHNRKLDKEFWRTNPKLLPNGFAPLVELAKANNIKLSLWFAASCNREYSDWQESAEILLDHFRKEDFESFKLDAVIFNSYTAEENFGKLLNKLYCDSDGKITVNLDVTNGTRGGLYKFAEYGLCFLENRYCCHDWPDHPYHPENTLDNLWNLAEYVRIQNLQIEVPNPGDVLKECYTMRNMTQPTDYPLEYWLLIAFFASPLLWMAPSLVGEKDAAIIAELLKLYRQHRSAWQQAIVSPVGNRPDGSQITGFYADSGYLLIFREANAPATTTLQLSEFKQAEVIYSNGNVELQTNGTVTIEQPRTAALLRLQ